MRNYVCTTQVRDIDFLFVSVSLHSIQNNTCYFHRVFDVVLEYLINNSRLPSPCNPALTAPVSHSCFETKVVKSVLN